MVLLLFAYQTFLQICGFLILSQFFRFFTQPVDERITDWLTIWCNCLLKVHRPGNRTRSFTRSHFLRSCGFWNLLSIELQISPPLNWFHSKHFLTSSTHCGFVSFHCCKMRSLGNLHRNLLLSGRFTIKFLLFSWLLKTNGKCHLKLALGNRQGNVDDTENGCTGCDWLH